MERILKILICALFIRYQVIGLALTIRKQGGLLKTVIADFSGSIEFKEKECLEECQGNNINPATITTIGESIETYCVHRRRNCDGTRYEVEVRLDYLKLKLERTDSGSIIDLEVECDRNRNVFWSGVDFGEKKLDRTIGEVINRNYGWSFVHQQSGNVRIWTQEVKLNCQEPSAEISTKTTQKQTTHGVIRSRTTSTQTRGSPLVFPPRSSTYSQQTSTTGSHIRSVTSTVKLDATTKLMSGPTKTATTTYSMSPLWDSQQKTSPSAESHQQSQNKTGIAVGVTVVAVILIVGIIVAIIFILRRRKQNARRNSFKSLKTKAAVMNHNYQEDSEVYQDPTADTNLQKPPNNLSETGDDLPDVEDGCVPDSIYYSEIGPSAAQVGDNSENPDNTTSARENHDEGETYYSVIPETQPEQVVIVENDLYEPAENQAAHGSENTGEHNSTAEETNDYFELENNGVDNSQTDTTDNYFVLEN